MRTKEPSATRARFIEVVTDQIRQNGYSGTSVEVLCAAAGASKGSFFHHFENKEDLAIAAAQVWGSRTSAFFAAAPYRAKADPRDRILAYVDFRIEIIGTDITRFTCYLGTVVQEVHDSHPRLRDACNRELVAHVAELEKDLRQAKAIYAPDATWDPWEVGTFIQASIQGAFILSKAQQTPQVTVESIRHVKAYLELLLGRP